MKIAVVDDEAPIRKWFSKTIGNISDVYEVTGEYKNGAEALEGVIAEQPDVIFADIQMPGMDGIELMKQVKERFPEIEIVILTNYAEFSYAKQAVVYGAVQYLLKSEVRKEDIETILLQISRKKQKTSLKVLTENDRKMWYEWNQEWDIPQNAYGVMLAVKIQEKIWDEQYLSYFCKVAGASEIFLYQDTLILYYWGMKEQLEMAARCREVAVEVISKTETTDCIVGISVQKRGEDSWICLHHSLEALEYSFIETEKILEYEKLVKTKFSDMQRIQNTYKDMMEQLFAGKYGVLEKKIKEFFAESFCTALEDVREYKKLCRRFILALEEKYLQLCPSENALFIPSTLDNVNRCGIYAAELLYKIVQESTPPNTKVVREAVQYLHNHYQEQISLSDMAKISCLSTEYFCRIFKEEMGQNFSSYLMILRLKKARELLLGTDLKIHKVASMVGYETAGYFSKIYKKYYGITPEQERKYGK